MTTRISTNTQKLNNTLETIHESKKEDFKELKKYIEINENKIELENLWNAGKYSKALRGIFIALNIYMRKDKNSQINNLRFYLKKLEKIIK